MLLAIIILISVYLGILFLKKNEDFNIEYIIKHGTLHNKESLVGQVFYKCATKDCYGHLYYYTYIRLNNGKDITIKREDVYRKFNFCDKMDISKYVYVHNSYRLVFYLIELDEFNKIRLCTDIQTSD